MATMEDQTTALATRIAQEINNLRASITSSSVQHVRLTASQYNALATKDPNTVYYVTD